MLSAMNPPDEYAQADADYSGDLAPSPDYSGGSNVNRTRKRSGKPSKEAKAAQMRRYRARHRSQSRDYMLRYMKHRRAATRQQNS